MGAGIESPVAGAVSLSFSSAPAVLPAYLRILLAHKPRMVTQSVPRIQAELASFKIDQCQLARYREVCGERDSNELPIAYPHIIATPVHLAMVASDAFPLSVMGVVHVRNRIVQKRPLRVDETGDIHSRIEGYRETSRGQELDLRTEARVHGEAVWTETCTFLARRGRRGPPRSGGATTHPAQMPPPEAIRTSNFAVAASTGRRYARVSGDLNPIHMADLAARFFGFKHAIAHGMWSLARCAAELGRDALASPCTLDVAFKLPIAFPARVVLESWPAEDGLEFTLRDSRGARTHLLGSIHRFN
jgi:acyl dehydratase